MTTQENDIVVFAKSERVSLFDLSDDDINKRFAGCKRLLVTQDQRLVLAASKSGHTDKMIKEYRKAFPNEEITDRNLISWSGPKALEMIAASMETDDKPAFGAPAP